MLPLIAAGVAAAANIAASKMQADASEEAASKQAAAQQAALDYTKQRYAEAQGNLAPYLASGVRANQDLSALVAGMQQPTFDYQQQPFTFDAWKDPGAQYALSEADKALNASSIAKGATGGGAVRALQTQAHNLGQTNYQNAFGRYMDTSNMMNTQAQQKYGRGMDWLNTKLGANKSLAGAGQEAAMGLGGFGTQQSNLASGIIGSRGATQAAGTLGVANAISRGISGLGEAIESGVGRYAGTSDMQAPASYSTTTYQPTSQQQDIYKLGYGTNYGSY